DETVFKIERCTGNNCTNFAEIAQVGANVTTFPNGGLAKNTWYRYRVRASNGNGDSAYSNIATEKTPPKYLTGARALSMRRVSRKPAALFLRVGQKSFC